MRISELLNESEVLTEITRPNKYKAEEILRNAGYKTLGEGTYGTVFAKPGADHVLKLFLSTDKAYLSFIDLVNSTNNIHFPKFKGKLIRVTDEYYAIRMEILTRVADNTQTAYAARAMSNFIRMKQGLKPHTQTPEQVATEMESLEKSQPGIIETCEIIADGISKKYPIDLHNENYMMRGNVLVITDPVISWD
jgi:hypothetical protein